MRKPYPGYYIYSGNQYPIYDIWLSPTAYYYFGSGQWNLTECRATSDKNAPVNLPNTYTRIPSLAVLLACGSFPQIY